MKGIDAPFVLALQDRVTCDLDPVFEALGRIFGFAPHIEFKFVSLVA